MNKPFLYIANGRMYRFTGTAGEEISSGVLASFYRKVRESAARNEWKYSGSGAEFTGTYRPSSSPEKSVKAVRACVGCVGEHRGDLIYSIDIDRTSGIYRKRGESESEGIVLSSATGRYRDFDVMGDLMVTSAEFAGESNIAIKNLTTSDVATYTEGHTLDSQPVWSRHERGIVYFCSAGLPESAERPREDARAMSYNDMVNEMYAAAEPTLRGPSSICVLNVTNVTLDEILSNDKYDYLHPQDVADGTLYYIRRPYEQEKDGGNPLGCFLDVLLFPFRILRALFGFFNVFSAKYSGKTLSRSNVKHRDEEKMMIDGNLINAEKELNAAKKRGEKNPGIIPHSWELRKFTPDGEDILVRRGVVAFKAYDDGSLLLSNGSAILEVDPDGKEIKLLGAKGVVLIK